ncbi:uncharacterized protein [Ptychodera flava]|uniref:uncharacterized protein n=1 Tax=Ptychodera flava TaxID=63121 RepID=UPI00396A770F
MPKNDVSEKLLPPDEDHTYMHLNRDRLSKSDQMPTHSADDETPSQLLNSESSSNHSGRSLGSSTSIHMTTSSTVRSEDKPNVKEAEQTGNRQQVTEDRLVIGNQTLFDQSEFVSTLVHLSRKIAKQYGFVTLQFLNRGYLNLTKSWACNVKCMGVLPRVLFIATDQDALDGLSKLNIEIQVLLLPFETGFKLYFGEIRYYRFVLLRTWLVVVLLQRNIPVTVIESDAVWFDDALPFINKCKGFDIVSTSNSLGEGGISTGFIYINTTASGKRVWLDMFRKFGAYMKTQVNGSAMMSSTHSEMIILERVIQKTHVKVKTLPLKDFVSGLWYKNTTLRAITKPAVIQNNYIVGVDAKIGRAQTWGHWYLTNDGQCKDNTELLKCI